MSTIRLCDRCTATIVKQVPGIDAIEGREHSIQVTPDKSVDADHGGVTTGEASGNFGMTISVRPDRDLCHVCMGHALNAWIAAMQA